ncbi:uncharacterized protein LOC119309863 [Triticum dicoccoides]|uniref:uncharacterized protein LOC119309863 n=1 Tax=Triticum dicoccoides TaxID=85692 RepID=UPI001891DC3D|nr:uncharacterized protein LOC119309863 [Triticum dicoccoides]
MPPLKTVPGTKARLSKKAKTSTPTDEAETERAPEGTGRDTVDIVMDDSAPQGQNTDADPPEANPASPRADPPSPARDEDLPSPAKDSINPSSPVRDTVNPPSPTRDTANINSKDSQIADLQENIKSQQSETSKAKDELKTALTAMEQLKEGFKNERASWETEKAALSDGQNRPDDLWLRFRRGRPTFHRTLAAPTRHQTSVILPHGRSRLGIAMALRSSTATSLLSRTLRLLEPSAHRVPRVESRAASSSTGGGDPSGQEPAPAPMDSPIKVFSDLRGGGARGAAIDAGGSARKPVSLWPGMHHSPVTNALWEARSSIFEGKMDAGGNADAGPQTDLLTRTPAQSRTSIVYKFAADDILREQYRDPWNEMRIGKLLEDLDALAGTIAVKHCSDGDSTTRPLLLVTASVDKMVLMKPLRLDTEVKIIGAVTYVGRSSIDIQIEVTQVDQDGDVQSDPIALTANFTFVARDSVTGKSAPVNRLSPETEREKQLYAETEAQDKVKKRKREEQKGVLEKGVQKLGAEAERLKTLLAEGRVFSDFPALADRDSILMKDTRLENSLICQPQQRNLYGRIFGGFLMHRAFELAFSTAYAFVGQRPCFLEVDHVDFLKPVDVGDFLRFKSCVLFTQLENKWQPLVNVEVVAHVTRPELRKSEISNTFHFTFSVGSDALKNGVSIRNVVPSTEEEARRILNRMDAEGLFD